jgi:hypothetical protein
LPDEIDQGLVRLACFGREARDDIAKIAALELGFLVDGAREEALAQRAERDEADSELLECREYFGFRLSPPERVFALQSGDWLYGAGTADRLRAPLRTNRSA